MTDDLHERVVGLLIREYAARTQCTMTDGERAEWDADADAILALVRADEAAIRRAALEEAAEAIRRTPSLDLDGFVIGTMEAIAAIRALAGKEPTDGN